jgi:uncharacterized protein (TIGR02452 family)
MFSKQDGISKVLQRNNAKIIAEDTLNILNKGSFTLKHQVFDLVNSIDVAKNHTTTYTETPRQSLPLTITTNVVVTNESILQAAYRLKNGNYCALNFANATECGGGFQQGSIAQEETIARSSALYPVIKDSTYYTIHQQNKLDYFYTDTVIYSKDIPIFKTDNGSLIEPYNVSFITAAAPMRFSIEALLDLDPDKLDDQLEKIFESRMERILKVAAINGHKNIILGAWGCGAFGNDPYMVAIQFKKALSKNMHFENVLFPIYGDKNNLEIFKEVFNV